MILVTISDFSLNNVNQLIFVMLNCCVSFEAWTELNIRKASA
jgi:hypothetical protein